jgi:hypothetical protein
MYILRKIFGILKVTESDTYSYIKSWALKGEDANASIINHTI